MRSIHTRNKAYIMRLSIEGSRLSFVALGLDVFVYVFVPNEDDTMPRKRVELTLVKRYFIWALEKYLHE